MPFILDLAMFGVGLFLLVGLTIFGPVLVWHGFTYRPYLTTIVVGVIALAVIFAAGTYDRLFPRCHHGALLYPTSIQC